MILSADGKTLYASLGKDEKVKIPEGVEVGNYKDAFDRIAVCNSNIAILAEYLELEEKLENCKKELVTLNVLF